AWRRDSLRWGRRTWGRSRRPTWHSLHVVPLDPLLLLLLHILADAMAPKVPPSHQTQYDDHHHRDHRDDSRAHLLIHATTPPSPSSPAPAARQRALGPQRARAPCIA